MNPVWHLTTFTQNRDCLLNEMVMGRFLEMMTASEVKSLFSDEHFSVDVTLLAGLGVACLSVSERRKIGYSRIRKASAKV